MEANELMIGDWVNLSPGKANIPNYVMIHAIKYDNHVSKDYVFDIVFLSTGLVQYNYSIRSLKPIPITPEILEKNGFEACGYEELALEADEFCFVLQKGADGINAWWWEMFSSPIIPINHIHELQHVLRLYGIEKEITI